MKTCSLTSSSFKELSETILHAGTSIRFTANGSSMLPSIKDGDLLLIAPVSSDQIRFGDVLLFVNDLGSLFAHRVIRMQKQGKGRIFEMRSDQAQSADGWIPADRILGRLVAFDHAGRSFYVNRIDIRVLSLLLALRGRYKLISRIQLPLIQKMLKLLPVLQNERVQRLDDRYAHKTQ